uniref:Uncharacterized protein n=1 Tax=uncultured Candidatus Melainabacteria bacterium TaxID=2682970 RepID=A0A650EJC2_9BACT|nr:hypothetical protein Melaina855_0900 [uncultured Candidatus Melainabacteria bacterium]
MAKLKEFFNHVSGTSRIYTAEDIGEMSGDEFSEHEKAIDYQMGNLGIPRRNDLAGNPDVVYVQDYVRSDGTQVKAHYRSSDNSFQNASGITGAAANISTGNNLKDKDFTPSLWNIPYYQNLNNKLEHEVGDFLNSKTNNPKLYSNDIRHQYVSALYAKNKGIGKAKFLGNLNEFFDANQSGREDTEVDQINNQIGREYAIRYSNLSKSELLNKLLLDWDMNKQRQQRQMKNKGF